MPRSVQKRSKKSGSARIRNTSLSAFRHASRATAIPEPSLPPATATPHTSPLAEPGPSASSSKLNYFASTTVGPESQALPTTLVDLNSLQGLFQNVKCSLCNCANLSLAEGTGSMAFGVQLKLVCKECGHEEGKAQTSKKCGNMVEINRRFVATCMNLGLGHSGIQKLSEGMGMPGIHHTSYLQHVEEIFRKTPDIANVILGLARKKVLDFYRDHHPTFFIDECLNLPVSFDGSWPKRGHTSKLGFGAVIDVNTGLVLDFHVLSLHCQVCESTGKCLKSSAGYEAWLTRHKASGDCTQNYSGSSGGMEVEAARVLWKRSTHHTMRYTTLVGDGDTKTFLALTKEKPYGEGHLIRKEECVNHVSKRLNTGLRNLKSSLSKQSVRIGGNAKGSLTDDKIGRLQSYYTRAVRSSDSVESMSKAIWAAYHHSTNKHDTCPEGLDSWCWFQKDLARGISEPKIGSRKQSTFLNDVAAKYVKGVYERLTDPSLLSRCLLGKTQNNNESLHSVIWAKCPKHLWSGYKKVYIACLLGVGEFNMGSLALRIFLDGIGCSFSDRTVELGEKRDRKRIRKSEDERKESVRRRREVRKCAQQRETQMFEEQEGGPSYVPVSRTYYRKAVRSNDSADYLSRTIWAAYYPSGGRQN